MNENGVMNKSILEAEGNILVISQFTLIRLLQEGQSAPLTSVLHDRKQLFPYMNTSVMNSDRSWTRSGHREFGADMKVELLNNGPVTICMDSKNKE